MKKTVRDRILKDSVSIWLDVNLKTLNKRVNWNKKRPLINEKEKDSQIKINQLYAERKNIYKLANHRINCNNLSKKDIVKTFEGNLQTTSKDLASTSLKVSRAGFNSCAWRLLKQIKIREIKKNNFDINLGN